LPSYETTFDGDLVDAINAAILAVDPDGRTVPYMLPGGTDAKAFARLGIRCFGFAPLKLPPDLDFAALFHGVDERVPVDALKFGTQVLEHFLLHS
jgi:acetylornithine deacetylase/succinyl-diaminopimelate desuccinylase-like protein